MQTVDRSYSPYKSIREYVDRRKMKWNPFATAELNAVHREKRHYVEEEASDVIEYEELLERVNLGIKRQSWVDIFLKKDSVKVGPVTIKNYLMNPIGIVVQNKEQHYQLIPIQDIANIVQSIEPIEEVEYFF